MARVALQLLILFCSILLSILAFKHSPLFLITNLGNHGVILGRMWLERHQVLVDCARRKLLWPKSYPPTVSYARCTPILNLHPQKVNARHQHDAERRDAALNRAW